ncbi:aspartyl protease family protein At5g10770-like [Rhododendron vialii]|uniref:aspartyl protease family protein At5g10770-like n=1 Tax=Rhododendron vialii TaxID=182163 RepID=UPI00265DEFD8|nr:aspartyl protease family protein At5g10770-like [Rhododendron vialii]
MASIPITTVSIGHVLYAFLVSLSILLISSSNKVFAVGGGQTFHTIQVTSLLPSSVCSPSTKDHNKIGSLKVVHRHGPCSQLNQDQANTPTMTEILSHDQSRVESIQHRLGFSKAQNRFPGSRATLPDKSGDSIGSGNYIVMVGLGTPKKDLSLVIDTGSGLTWTQCEPCVKCYHQEEPTFNPSSSQSYRNITCDSPRCSQLTSATGNSPGCATTTCVYGIRYSDSSFSVGLLGSEKLTLTPSDVFPHFIFGCGKNNQGLFYGAAGLLGLDRGPFSTVSQTAFKYGNYFSYCLPSDSSSTGTLTFGKGGTKSTDLKFTPLLVNPQATMYYFVGIIGIKVGGEKLPISESVFKTPGTIIDSGTTFTRLQPGAYAALRTSFLEATKDYNRTAGGLIFDTCYDFTGYDTVRVPTISFLFAGNIEVPIDVSGILIYVGSSRFCLAFAGNSDASNVGIFGNVQQQTLDVVHDVAGGKIGFGTRGCS